MKNKISKPIKRPTVTFNIGLPQGVAPSAVYIVGSTELLGGWQPERAVQVKRNKYGAYIRMLKMEVGTKFEFKIIAWQDFYGVEKGRYFEELENRVGEVKAGKNRYIVEVKSFRSLERTK